ncbi:cupin domain-containing protein [Tenacibaculum aiptasiae]|uniref:Cupin domain-containing protein n=1 Tax=Tenacibaculum aiptasiae TaxID=426481 RepID=A0A7J5APB3_9FLAO|nr:cupin domain-containing protein [Tenacibaculum aiptasiae]KAB1159456.1 cupin domain-containing protein [Tenacibaculum aiptasiae]
MLPEIIDRHPSAIIPLEGVTSKLIQAGNQQFIFMEFENDAEVPTHSHNAQWGIVLDGEMELTIDGKPRLLKKGDSYFIEKDVLHSAKIKAGYKDLTLFDQADRYKTL